MGKVSFDRVVVAKKNIGASPPGRPTPSCPPLRPSSSADVDISKARCSSPGSVGEAACSMPGVLA